MNTRYYKLLFKAFLIFILAGMLGACKKHQLQPNHNISGSDTTGNDSTIVADNQPSFYSPAGLAVDASGNIYVADYGNNLIRKITPTGLVSTFAGSGTQGSINATGILASFNQPTGLAVDAAGNVYVGDAGNDRIRLITPAGVVSTLAGSDSTGMANGLADSATFFHPEGVAVDAAGNLFVADAGNTLIRKISKAGLVSTFAGNDIGSTVSNTFSNPTGLAADAAGNVYVANYINNNILKITPAGVVSVLAGSGDTGNVNGAGSVASFYYPNSVAVDAAGNVFVADEINNMIRKITPSGTVSTLAGSGTAGATDGIGSLASFDGPAGVALDVAGNVYVADSNNNLIRKVTADGVVTTVAGSGASGAKNGQAVARKNTKSIKAAAKKRLPVFYH